MSEIYRTKDLPDPSTQAGFSLLLGVNGLLSRGIKSRSNLSNLDEIRRDSTEAIRDGARKATYPFIREVPAPLPPRISPPPKLTPQPSSTPTKGSSGSG